MLTNKNPRRVLLVDGDSKVLALFKTILESSGFIVTAASEGGAAAKFHSDLGSMDLLITDIDMPGQTGFELADALSINQPDLPVLFIAGGLFPADTARIDVCETSFKNRLRCAHSLHPSISC